MGSLESFFLQECSQKMPGRLKNYGGLDFPNPSGRQIWTMKADDAMQYPIGGVIALICKARGSGLSPSVAQIKFGSLYNLKLIYNLKITIINLLTCSVKYLEEFGYGPFWP